MKVQCFPEQQILDSSKLKEFAYNNFKFVKNGRELSKQVENTVGKGEIACYEQFLLFPLFLKRLFKDGRELSKQVENTVGKGEIARYEQFLLFPHCFKKNFTADM